jgi:outer membrane biosynthesis protein TonB
VAKAESIAEPIINPVRQEEPVLGIALSIALHAAVIGAFYLSWPFFKKDTVETPPIIVDLVQISDITAAPPQPAPEVKEEPPKPDQEPPKPEEAAPKPDEMPPPEPPKPQPPPPEPKPEPPPVKVPPPPPPKPQPPKPKNDMAQLQQLLKDLEKKQPQKSEQKQADPNAPKNQATAQSDRATMTELDAIRSHIESCWRVDPGQEGIENLSAEIRVFINPDGSVQEARIIDMARYFTDQQFRTFANTARISVLGCKGIPITAAHYNELKDMVLNFSPQGRIN